MAGRGLRGDRFFDYQENYKGQIAFFAMEVFEALRRELNLRRKTRGRASQWIRARANLPSLIGKTFSVHGVRFQGVEEAKPCHWMNTALGPGQSNGCVAAPACAAGFWRWRVALP